MASLSPPALCCYTPCSTLHCLDTIATIPSPRHTTPPPSTKKKAWNISERLPNHFLGMLSLASATSLSLYSNSSYSSVARIQGHHPKLPLLNPSLPLAHPSSCSTTNGLLIPVHHHTSPSFFSHFRPYRPKPNKKAYSRPITFHNRTLQSSNHRGNHCRPPNPPPSLPSNPSCSAVAWLELPTLAFRSRRALVPLGRPSPHASFQSNNPTHPPSL